MPRIDKLSSGSPPGNPLEQPMDGFDPLIPYQMVPLGGSREMVVHTDNFDADLRLTTPNIATMTNFRILRQTRSAPFPLPPPGFIVLPKQSDIQFTLIGGSVGMTVLEGRDLPPGAPPLRPEFKLLVSVKRLERREFAVCYLFDRINRDRGVRHDFPGHFVEVNNVFQGQANINIVNSDGISAGTRAARTLPLRGTMGRVFDLDDFVLIGRVIDEFDAKFPGLSASKHAVTLSVPVPLRLKSRPAARILGVSIQWRRRSTGRAFSVLLIGPQSRTEKPNQGGAQPSQVRLLRHTIAHEIGHSLGLDHNPNNVPAVLIQLIRNFNPGLLFEPQNINLMFPIEISEFNSNRINGGQVEIMHLLGPQFREADI